MEYFQEPAFIKQIILPRRFCFIKKLFYLSVVLLLIPGVVLADDKQSPQPQWKLCWQLPNLELSGIQPTIQNGSLFIATPGGRLIALNSLNGEILWRTELGGEIIGQTPSNANFVYAASQIAAAKDTQAAIVIRALSVETGLTVWQGEFSAASKVTLTLFENYLLIGTGDLKGADKIIALTADRGELLWTQTQSNELSTTLTVIKDSLIFATADKILHFLKISDGHEIQRFVLSHQAQEKIASGNGKLIFGDKAGNVIAIGEGDGKTSWKLRIGAAPQNILTSGNGVLISSLDDFVYFHNVSNGRRIWRKRLASRPFGAALLSETTVILTATGENNSTVLSLKKGEVITQLLLGAENVVVGAPFASNNFIFVPTINGLFSFAPVVTNCPNK